MRGYERLTPYEHAKVIAFMAMHGVTPCPPTGSEELKQLHIKRQVEFNELSGLDRKRTFSPHEKNKVKSIYTPEERKARAREYQNNRYRLKKLKALIES